MSHIDRHAFRLSLIWPHSKSMHRNGLGDLVFPTVQYLSHCCISPLACHMPFYLARAGGCKSKTCRERLRVFEIARVLVRLDHVAGSRRKRESRHHVSGCRTSRSQTASLTSVYHSRPNGSASEIRSTPRRSVRGRTS